jgi:hypothetical protein
LRETPAVNAPSHRDLTCGRCGAAFVCGAGGRDGHCWCFDELVRLPMPRSADEDCLCPKCLRAFASETTEAAP